MQELAKELEVTSKQSGEKSVVDEDTQRELAVHVLAINMLKTSRDPEHEDLFEMRDHYAERFKRSWLVELVKNNAKEIADCVRKTIHSSLNGQAVPDSRALDLRIAETSINMMEYFGEELLRESRSKSDQIDCETTLDPVQAKQVHQTLKSILQTWRKSTDHKDIQAIICKYDQYASTRQWQCMHDAVSADLEKVKIVDRELLQEYKAWQFDRK
jgi:hypothetical protein